MRLPIFIAKRYLFSQKKQNAINIISFISIVGVTIGTSALIVILSVFNGMDILLQKSTDTFSPDIIISATSGKYFTVDSTFCQSLNNISNITSYSNIIEEKALAKYGSYTTPVIIKGVSEDYSTKTHFDKNIFQGKFKLKDGQDFFGIFGYGVAAQLHLPFSEIQRISLYYPNKNKGIHTHSLNIKYLHPSAFFSSQQDLDAQYIITDLDFAKQLFNIGNCISKIEIRVNDEKYLQQTQQELESLLGKGYNIKDKYQINKAFYGMLKSEKLAVFLILLFILVIASFNIIGSISMLILDKKEDLTIYKAMGMTNNHLINIFKTEGNLITVCGAILGLIIGTTICLLQEKYGFITLGDGSYIIEAYPIKLVFKDVIIILITVIAIGYIASYFPVRYLIHKLCSKDFNI